jgi:Flp pilus assembly protein TadG
VRRGEDGQAMTELALLVPLLLVLVFGVIELANAINEAMTIAAATREGARVAGALVNGGGGLGCASGNSPNSSSVDPVVIAAIERVLTGSGAQVSTANVTDIHIYKATATGAETSGAVNVWVYSSGSGPVVAGQPLDFVQRANGWPACVRNNVTPADSVGITVRYVYQAYTPLRLFIPGLSSINLSDSAVMPLNATR